MRGARFRGVWRDYQASVLATVDHCLADGRLHIVAAPGSGKTVLGLELVRKLGRPAIILSPTVTIRSQWIERLCELFIEADAPCPDWTSTSLAAPGQLTVSTYQALHAGSDPGSSAGVTGWLEPLKALGPVTLVLDEAHHLRREWWRALQRLVEAIPDAVIVSLTATPPYDVPLAEWQRYESLCGPVDAEIAIPELVRNGDLCPHQDYVHLSTPTAAETRYLAERRAGLTALFEGLLDDSTFLDALASHPWLTDPPSHEEAILDDPETLSAMLIALAAEGWPLPRPALQLLGIEGDPTPPLSPYWFERLLDAVLVDQHDIFAALGRRLAELKAELQRLGAFEGGRVRIRETERLVRLMAGSAAKLESIIAIARSEGETLGDRLRMVVLADHVRIGDLPGPEDDRVAPAKLGVATIFDALRREGMADGAIGVVSGALVIVPDGALGALDEAAICCGVETYHIDCEPLPHGPGYSRISFGGESGHRIVAVMTRLFRDGHIRLLVGTQALLGEGWDAPSINTLVLASNVGSYMLSNQMRGRAIRTDPSDPAKVANIWHLATVEPEEPGTPVLRRFRWTDALPPSDPIGQPLGPDMELLKRRFRAFAGIAADGGNRIESGLARLDLGGRRWDAEAIAATNAEALHRAADRSAVAERWAASLGGVDRTHAMRQAARPTYAPRSLPFVDTLQYLAITGLAGGVLPAGNALRNAGGMGLGLGWLVMALAGLTLVYAAPKLLRAGYLLLRNGTLEASLGQVGRVLLETLDEAGLLSFPPEACSVIVDRTLRGERIVMLDGADRAGERLFLDAMTELLGPMGNPRYLLVRRSFLARRLRIDYHAVPAVLGQRKEWAEMFAKHWAKRVGRAELVFTRNAEGRRFLLVARTRSLAAGFRRDVDLLTAWH